nr:hypothetical protein [Tanacetum cinerariifolium]
QAGSCRSSAAGGRQVHGSHLPRAWFRAQSGHDRRDVRQGCAQCPQQEQHQWRVHQQLHKRETDQIPRLQPKHAEQRQHVERIDQVRQRFGRVVDLHRPPQVIFEVSGDLHLAAAGGNKEPEDRRIHAHQQRIGVVGRDAGEERRDVMRDGLCVTALDGAGRQHDHQDDQQRAVFQPFARAGAGWQRWQAEARVDSAFLGIAGIGWAGRRGVGDDDRDHHQRQQHHAGLPQENGLGERDHAGDRQNGRRQAGRVGLQLRCRRRQAQRPHRAQTEISRSAGSAVVWTVVSGVDGDAKKAPAQRQQSPFIAEGAGWSDERCGCAKAQGVAKNVEHGANPVGARLPAEELASGFGDDLFHGDTRRGLAKDECAVFDFQVSQVGQHLLDAAGAGQRQAATRQQLGLAVLRRVGHGDDDVVGAGHQVHCAAHALDQLAGDHPRSNVALDVDFKGTEHGQVEAGAVSGFSDGTLLDALLERAEDHAIHVDAGGMDFGRQQHARLDDFFHFHHGDLAGGRYHGVEVLRGVTVHHITEVIGLPAFDDGEVAGDGLFQYHVAAIELSGFFAFRHRRAVAGGRIERGNAGAACAHFFSEGALGRQLDLQLTAEQLALEQGVFTDVGGDHFADLPVFQEDAKPETVDAAVVGNHRQAFHAHAFDFCDQVFGDAAQTETAGQHGHVVGQPGEGFCVARAEPDHQGAGGRLGRAVADPHHAQRESDAGGRSLVAVGAAVAGRLGQHRRTAASALYPANRQGVGGGHALLCGQPAAHCAQGVSSALPSSERRGA